MSKVREIIRLTDVAGLGQRQISRALGISRPVVDHYQKQIASVGLHWEDIAEISDEELLERIRQSEQRANDPRYVELVQRLPRIVSELGRRGVTRLLLWEEYRREVPHGYEYSQFCHHIRIFTGDSELSMHLEHTAGEALFIDYAGQSPVLTDPKTGIERPVELFVATYPASALIYIQATATQRIGDTIAATRSAFEYAGGASRIIVPDNLRAAVTKPDRYEPDINATFAAFAEYYGCAVIPARPERPRDKALVEAAVNLVYTRVLAPLRDRTFATLDALNEALWESLQLLNDRPMQKIGMSRRQRFTALEAGELRSLPSEPYELRQYTPPVTVQTNYHAYFRLDQHYYSVPYRYRGLKVRIAYTDRSIEIYQGNVRIALHRRDTRAHQYTTERDHMPSTHRFLAEWSPQRLLKWAAQIGVETQALIGAVLDTREVPEQAFRSCMGILRLADRYGSDRLEAAAGRANRYRIVTYKAVANILKKRLDEHPPPHTNAGTIPQHRNIRGPQAFEIRQGVIA